MTHKLTSYTPHLDEFVLVRQAFTNVVAQVVALAPDTREAWVAYLIPGAQDTTREIRKKVPYRMLLPYEIEGDEP